MSLKPFVSVVIPCLNEEETIQQALDSILANNYPHDRLEIIIVDGMSQDKTRNIIRQYQESFSFIQTLDNPQGGQNTALNIGIQNSRGEFIVRMDAHSSLSYNYISQCIKYINEYKADVVGGRITTSPRDRTAMGYAIASVMSEQFGVGKSEFRVADESNLKPKWVDTVPFACYKRSVFDRAGYFHKQLNRSEDVEFHIRVRKSGMKILFVPLITSHYYARSKLKSFWVHALDNGYWAILPTLYTKSLVISYRHMVPMIFVTSIFMLLTLSANHFLFFILLLFIFGLHLLISLIISFRAAIRTKKPKLFFLMPLLFLALHIGYGIGSYKGIIKIYSAKFHRFFLSKKEAL